MGRGSTASRRPTSPEHPLPLSHRGLKELARGLLGLQGRLQGDPGPSDS